MKEELAMQAFITEAKLREEGFGVVASYEAGDQTGLIEYQKALTEAKKNSKDFRTTQMGSIVQLWTRST